VKIAGIAKGEREQSGSAEMGEGSPKPESFGNSRPPSLSVWVQPGQENLK
jgi:hypothetical protein